MFGRIRKSRGGVKAQRATCASGAVDGALSGTSVSEPAKSHSHGEDAAQLKRRGNALLSQGLLEPATECYRQATGEEPHDADSWVNFGFALTEQRLFGQAEEPLRRAVSLAPDSSDAHYLLAVTLRELGQAEIAIEHFRQALAIQPGFVVCRRELCRLLFGSDQPWEAREVVAQGLAADPNNAELHFDLGNLQVSTKEYAGAIASFERGLTIQPGDGTVLTNLGHALHQFGRLDAAIERQKEALAIQPDLAQAHLNLGAVLYARGLLDASETSIRQALRLKPGYVDAYVNLGPVLQAQGRIEEAAESQRSALVLAPHNAEAHNNLSTVLLEQGHSELAIEHLHAALRKSKTSPHIHCNLGAAFQRLGLLDKAADHYRLAVELDPGMLVAHSNLLFVLSFLPDCSPEAYLAEARTYGEKARTAAHPFTRWPMSMSANRRPVLRVGMVSGDLKAHPVGYFIESLLRNLDPTRFELVAYPTQPREDELTARIKPLFSAWTPLYGFGDIEAAKRIHDDGIDVLVDLAGHSAHNRLPVFAWRPAPVQLSWLGYFASTGVPGIDWLMADEVSVPERHQQHFSETICYVPDTRLCFTPPHDSVAVRVGPLPALGNGHVTFGCFQVSSKITAAVVAVWARILSALPTARLRVQNQEMKSPAGREVLLARLRGAGIAAERVMLVAATPRDEYLAAHANVDIILDTFPYPGGTTTCEALWMGVPTLTLVGETLLARQGASLLACAGLMDWVAGDEDDYVERALAHATDLRGLAQLRKRLRQQVLASPLFNAPRFARRVEAALQDLWVRRPIAVDDQR